MPPENDPPRLRPLTPPSFDERLDNLERVVFAGEDLASAVERLGMNANALGEALLTVDKNQQMLTRLGRQLEAVEAASATKDDVKAQAKETRSELLEYRRHVIARSYAASVIGLALLFGIGLAVANDIANRTRASQQQCEMAQQQRRAVIGYLTQVEQYGNVPALRAAAQHIVTTLPPIQCDAGRFG